MISVTDAMEKWWPRHRVPHAKYVKCGVYGDDWVFVTLHTNEEYPYYCGYVLTDRPMPDDLENVTPDGFPYRIGFYKKHTADGVVTTCIGFFSRYDYHVDMETLEANRDALALAIAISGYEAEVFNLTFQLANYVKETYPLTTGEQS